jgi:hypothetical protein
MRSSLLFGITLTLLSLSACAATPPTANFNVSIFNENNKPVEGVLVKGGFTNLMADYVPGPGAQGVSDINGNANIFGPAFTSVRVIAEKDGYYRSEKRIPVNQRKDQNIEFVLRDVRNPRALNVKKIFLSARDKIRSGEQFGYDLEIGDFVYPNGKGKVNDFLITHTYQKKDMWNYSFEIVIEFSNALDGLIPFFIDNSESRFKSAYLVPETGYKNKWHIKGSRSGKGKPEVTNLNKQRNYYFRVRTVVNENNEIVSAHYGKIYGEFPEIVYYFNPTPNDRNVEFDLGKNLFKNLKHEEKIGIMP